MDLARGGFSLLTPLCGRRFQRADVRSSQATCGNVFFRVVVRTGRPHHSPLNVRLVRAHPGLRGSKGLQPCDTGERAVLMCVHHVSAAHL
jgi:hypothetical protein